MHSLRNIVYLISGVFLSVTCYGQEESVSPTSFEALRAKSLELSRVGLYAESIEAIDEAVKFANENGLEEQAIMVQIDLAEVMRKTQEFEGGLRVLQNIENSTKYPLQHVRLLDRSVALIFEGNFYSDEKRKATIQSLLDSAITLAERNDFRSEEALLKNQKGYSLDKKAPPGEALSYHLEAADIFLELNDTLNYIGAMTKAMVIYGNHLNNIGKTDSIISLLLHEFEGKEWHAPKSEVYGFMADYYLLAKKDSFSHFKWQAKRYESLLMWKNQISSTEMDNFRVQQETLRFQQEADAAALALEIEENRNRTLFTILTVLALAIFSVAFLFYRERQLKKEMRKINGQLKVANDKYQMLMVESNHRIKNNLQTVISMLEIASRDVDPSNKRTLKRMSGKIHTVSLLHKHLTMDTHNEYVSLSTYFEKIIKLTTEMASGELEVNNRFDEVNIRSERIVYFGLILNEMLTNTLEHNKQSLKNVNLEVAKNETGYEFQYEDNSAWDPNYKKGTGTQLIERLVKRIGGSNYHFNPDSGAYKFIFNVQG